MSVFTLLYDFNSESLKKSTQRERKTQNTETEREGREKKGRRKEGSGHTVLRLQSHASEYSKPLKTV